MNSKKLTYFLIVLVIILGSIFVITKIPKKEEKGEEYIPQEEINNEEEKEIFSETSSYCESVLGNGVYLTQVKKVISQARNYTSQSFFIDKNIGNSLTNNYQINTHNANQYL